MAPQGNSRRRRIRAGVLSALAAGLLLALAWGVRSLFFSPHPGPRLGPIEQARRVEKNGVVVELGVTPSDQQLLEGALAKVEFRIRDSTTGEPLRGRNPAAWMDIASDGQASSASQPHCKERVALYLKGMVGIRPLVDLNSYYLLVLNRDPTISVIDPVVTVTGKTSLYATVPLKRPGADWAKSRDEKWLYVTMPTAGELAVVDTESFRVKANVPVGKEPTRAALQPDGKYLWIGNDSLDPTQSGVTVLDTDTMSVVATIATGRGHHELALTPDDRFAFVTNRDEGTVSVIDVAELELTKELRLGPLPISVAVSPLSRAAYVADGREGTISAIDASSLEVIGRIRASPGLGPLRFSPDGRWGLAVNPVENAVYAIDAAQNRLAHTIPVGGQPYQVSFTRAFAYVRLLDSESFRLVDLSSIAAGRPTVQSIAAGQGAPKLAGELSIADSISPAASDAAVFVVNPADNTTYFYMEGMNAPLGSFGNYGHGARAVAVVDRSLKESTPGAYGASLRLPLAGSYQVAFLLDSPPVLHCFRLEVRPNPALEREPPPLAAEYLNLPPKALLGQTFLLRFKLTDPSTGQSPADRQGVTVSYFAAPGRSRGEVPASALGGGIFQAPLSFRSAGTYYLYVTTAAQHAPPSRLIYRALQVEAPPAPEGSHVD